MSGQDHRRSGLAALAGLAALSAFLVGGQATARALFFRFRKPIGPPPPRLASAVPVSFAAPGGPTLNGWWLPAASAAQGAVVLVHGIGASRLTMVRRARILHQNNFSVLLFDQRAHGESAGSHTGFGRPETADISAALRFVRAQLPGARLGVIAISLGGAATVLGAAPPALDALVLESVFADIRPAIRTRIEAVLRPRIGAALARPSAPVLARIFEALMPLLIGVRRRALRPSERIGAIEAPILVMSGTEDPFTSAAETGSLFAGAAEPKTLWWADGAAHVDLERFSPRPYWGVVLPFLRAHLRTAPGPDRSGRENEPTSA